jgi:ABC-type bacteriocin/lantibiotic exporter with double-glycine peptidase domain
MKVDILSVKPFQETLHQGMCGPASLKMILDFYGIGKSEAELALLCDTNSRLGTNAKGIKKAAESLGFNVYIKDESALEDIQAWLDKKVPVMVDWFTRGRGDYDDSVVADGHLSVVVGLDTEYIYLQDPEVGGLRKIKREDFMKVWFDFSGELIKPSELIIRQIIAIHK